MADNIISINTERSLKPVKEQLDSIYKENLVKHKQKKIERYESEGRLSELSDDEYFKYNWEKKMKGCVYFWDRDSFFGIWVGNLRVGISYRFDKDKFEGRFVSLEGHGKVRLFNEKEFHEEWRKNIKFDEKYLEQLINEKKIEYEEDYNS